MNGCADKTNDARPGIFRLVARSAEEAAGAIRQRLGERANVVSVRSLPARGWQRLLGASRIEVIAEVPSPDEKADFKPGAPDPGAAVTPGTDNAGTGVSGLAGLLRRRGVSPAALRQLAALPFWRKIPDGLPLAESIGLMREALRRLGDARRGRPLPARAAFMGGPGAGKTTALCKWLHREVARHGRLGVVWWTSEAGGAVPAPLAACCGRLRVPLVRHGREASPAGGDFVYVDMPPVGVDAEADARARDWLEREEVSGRVLVLNAAYADGPMRAACKAGSALGATHVVLTHLDEVPCWAGLWDVLLDGGLAPLFLTGGPGCAPGITENVFEAMLERTIPMVEGGRP